MQTTFIGRGAVRKLWIGDREALSAHFQRLDPISRNRRFQGYVSDDYVTAYAERTLKRHGPVLYGYFDEGVLRAVAELHPDPGPFPSVAEIAFSVEPDYQEHGIGTELFRRLALSARNRGVAVLVMNCLPANAGMRRLCERFGGVVAIEEGEATARLLTDAPTFLSIMNEMVADGTGLAKAMLDQQLAVVRAA